ncbi:MAG: DUF4302 domain-containing protein [Bacteroidia bacterium]|nr:DUF4302 domain-containing protein [Bacteroidia bacterium]
MNNIKNILLLLTISCVLFSCTHQEESIFEDSATTRVDKSIKRNIEILTSNENGWVMEYFPSQSQAYGGYTFLMKFDKDGKVKVAGDTYDQNETTTSLYSLVHSGGVLLSFDTYNSFFHFFSSPINSDKVGAVGKGFEGDYEFLIMESSDEKIVLQGRKTSNVITMTPLQAGVKWNEFLNKIQTNGEIIDMTPEMVLTVDNKETECAKGRRQLIVSYNEDGKLLTKSLPYVVTTKGIRFYEPSTIQGQVFNELTLAEDKESLATADGKIKLTFIYPPLNEQLSKGNWYFAYSGLGEVAKKAWDEVRKNPTAAEEILELAMLGKDGEGKYGFAFNSGGYSGTLYYKFTLKDSNKITYEFLKSGSGNGVWYFNNAGFGNYLQPIAFSAPKTFTLTADNVKTPKWIKLTDDADSNNTFVLYRSEVKDPYNK